MCLAVPAQVKQLHDDATVTVDMGGVRQRVSVALLDGVVEGDYLIIHVGYALTKLDPEEAEATLQLLAAAGRGAAS